MLGLGHSHSVKSNDCQTLIILCLLIESNSNMFCSVENESALRLITPMRVLVTASGNFVLSVINRVWRRLCYFY